MPSFLRVSFCLSLGARSFCSLVFVFFSAEFVFADSEVNGFFRPDYVKAGVFQGQGKKNMGFSRPMASSRVRIPLGADSRMSISGSSAGENGFFVVKPQHTTRSMGSAAEWDLREREQYQRRVSFVGRREQILSRSF